jgi:hypoxanthine phosphoribosyltransferase
MGVLAAHHPASIRTCTLLYKTDTADADVPVDYVGFEIADKWVVGYGLDYAEKDRALPYIGIVSPEDRR